MKETALAFLAFVIGCLSGAVAGYCEYLSANGDEPSQVARIDAPEESIQFHLLTAQAAQERVNRYGGQFTGTEMVSVLIVAGWPHELLEDAMRVAWCESRWSPYARGDGGNSVGIFQLHNGWFGYAGEDPANWGSAEVNARVAYSVYRYDISRGYTEWKQWSCKP